MSRSHAGSLLGHMGGLCEEPHWCPECEGRTGRPCQDMFMSATCGEVACEGTPPPQS